MVLVIVWQLIQGNKLWIYKYRDLADFECDENILNKLANPVLN
jgi:hypothetical protein